MTFNKKLKMREYEKKNMLAQIIINYTSATSLKIYTLKKNNFLINGIEKKLNLSCSRLDGSLYIRPKLNYVIEE